MTSVRSAAQSPDTRQGRSRLWTRRLGLTREIATISIYPSRGRSHSSADDLSALAAYTRSLLAALPEMERRRHVVLTNIKSDAPERFLESEVEVREVWEKGRLRLMRQLLRAVRRTPSLKLIHLQHEFNQFGPPITIPLIPLLLWTIRFVLRKKVVITYHEVVSRELLTPELTGQIALPVPPRIAIPLFRIYYRATSFAANEIFVQHTKFRDILRNEMGVSTPIRILPLGSDVDVALADRMASREKYGIQSSERVLLYFGVLDWRKGLHVLIDAFERLPADDFRLIVGGGQPVNRKDSPEYQAWYSGVAERLERNPSIVNLGFVAEADIPTLFAAADLVVLPYIVPQVVSAVLTHAASHERPFIASQAFRGHAEPLTLFDADAETLAEKIRWSFNEHYADLEHYSRRYKHENSWTRSANLLAERYNAVLRRSRKPRTQTDN
jgi:glycosyltransferase involved in cell wall biosynthesis